MRRIANKLLARAWSDAALLTDGIPRSSGIGVSDKSELAGVAPGAEGGRFQRLMIPFKSS
jgi:hypothetical protein